MARSWSTRLALLGKAQAGLGTAVLCLLISCGGGANDPKPNPAYNLDPATGGQTHRQSPRPRYNLEESLPNGSWSGSGQQTCSDGAVYRTTVEVSIAENVMWTESFTDRLAEIAVDKFHYVSKGKSEWLDPNGNIVGECSCTPSDCDCSATSGALEVRRKLSFSTTGFVMHDDLRLGTLICQRDRLLSKTQ
jgi:hypothetical protein